MIGQGGRPSRFALIHPTVWKENSANFAQTEFYEVGLESV
jgi:hypothetical protein